MACPNRRAKLSPFPQEGKTMKYTFDRLALLGSALALACASADTALAQTEDYGPPIINELSISHSEVDLTDGSVELVIRYDIEDTGDCPYTPADYYCGTRPAAPSGLSQFDFDLYDETHIRILGLRAKLDGELSLQGEYRISLPAQLPAGEYHIWGRIRDVDGHWFNSQNSAYKVLPSTPESFTVINPNEDTTAPHFNALSFSPTTIDLSGANDRTVTIDYDVEDTGGAGLSHVIFRFKNVNEREDRRAYLTSGTPLELRQTHSGQIQVKVPETMPEGVYRLEASLLDNVRNGPVGYEPVAEGQTLTLTNFIEDRQAPVLISASVSRDSVDLSEADPSIVIQYEVEDVGTAGLSTLSFFLSGTNGGYTNSVENGVVYHSGQVELNGVASHTGEYVITLPSTAPTDTYRLRYSLWDEQDNRVLEDFPFTPNDIKLTDSHARPFGPFVWSDSEGNQTRDVFRVTGLEHGMPTQIRVALAYIENKRNTYGANVFSDCQLEVNPARYSGSEYLILLSDITSGCDDFGRSDLSLQIQAHPDDVEQLQVRRFKVSPTGMLTDFGVDRNAQSGHGEVVDYRLQFGPFEWVEVSGSRASQFRLSGLDYFYGDYLDIAISNASEPGYNGDFDDCRIHSEVASSTYAQSALITPEAILQACGDFGRADLTFRSRISYTPNPPAHMERLIVNGAGAVTDLSLDYTPAPASRPQFRDIGVNQVEFGPFEWTGDSHAPTTSLFRLTGVSGGAPERILVALENANVSGLSGEFTDCELPIRTEQTGENDYLITGADLAACGHFGRADIRFQIIAPETSLPFNADVRLRRLAVGAFGDLTDFGFDLDDRAALAPTPIGNGMSEMTFGPFEWTGDHTTSTQNVFRVSGINGAPSSIEVAIGSASQTGYSGDFDDCSLRIRDSRAGRNEYVIASNDLADCGGFTRADVRFRIRALTDQFAGDVRMRRFAVTSNGGLTDFGFDNQ
jgi:hypothetical protein